MNENLLINETSLYLLQHSKNPVNWFPWSDKAFEKAALESKIILVSIGYSSCHWCHVMEQECFEDEQVADLMNENFICIKVDREERPDVDHLYMKAIQLMGVNGGWPLNCFVLPDGSPIYGGTYFNKEQWLRILNALVDTYQNNKEKTIEFAEKLKNELVNEERIKTANSNTSYSEKWLVDVLTNWRNSFDLVDGGFDYVPKFPMPNNHLSLLFYGIFKRDDSIINHLNNTLLKMSFGGLFDQVEGGFARYSTDRIWKVPHFEKMLYDNAQLIELYSEGYKLNGSEEYKNVVYKTFEWLNSGLKTSYGSYLCSQDADSEGEEGVFYCWSESELESFLNEDFTWFKAYFNISNEHIWEGNKYILFRDKTLSQFALDKGWPRLELQDKLEKTLNILNKARSLREKPCIDTKSLTSWNALLIKGLCKAYLAFDDVVFLQSANEIASWIKNNQLNSDHSIHHNFVHGKATIEGFLEDYAFTIDAFILLYQVSGDIELLEHAKNMAEKVEEDFYSEEHDLCFFSNSNSKLIARKIVTEDDVIPSSNSVMAHCFYDLGVYYRRVDWISKSQKMLSRVIGSIEKYPTNYSNWFLLYFRFTYGNSEISILQDYAVDPSVLKELIHPLRMIAYHNSIPMSKDFSKGIYVCENQSCLPKINSLDELILKFRNDKEI